MKNYTDSYEKKCAYCNQPFVAERISRRFCSDSCRQLAYLDRRAEKLANASFVEEANFEIIPVTVISNPDDEVSIDRIIEVAETVEEGDSNSSDASSTDNRSRSAKSRKHGKSKGNQIDPRLVLLGSIIIKNLAEKYLSKK